MHKEDIVLRGNQNNLINKLLARSTDQIFDNVITSGLTRFIFRDNFVIGLLIFNGSFAFSQMHDLQKETAAKSRRRKLKQL